MPTGLPATVNVAARPSTNVGLVDRFVFGLPAEFAEEGVDGAASGGVAAFAADFDEGDAAFFARAGDRFVIEVGDVVDFEIAAAASGGGGFRGGLRTGRP